MTESTLWNNLRDNIDEGLNAMGEEDLALWMKAAIAQWPVDISRCAMYSLVPVTAWALMKLKKSKERKINLRSIQAVLVYGNNSELYKDSEEDAKQEIIVAINFSKALDDNVVKAWTATFQSMVLMLSNISKLKEMNNEEWMKRLVNRQGKRMTHDVEKHILRVMSAWRLADIEDKSLGEMTNYWLQKDWKALKERSSVKSLVAQWARTDAQNEVGERVYEQMSDQILRAIKDRRDGSEGQPPDEDLLPWIREFKKGFAWAALEKN